MDILRDRIVLAVALFGQLAFVARGADQPKDPVPPNQAAIEQVAPVLPADVLAALQEARYNDASVALQKLQDEPKTPKADRPYIALVRGVALRLDKKLDDARAVLTAALANEPAGTWSAKLRSELVTVELSAGRFPEAEKLARAEAERLLEPGRKDVLAGVYQAFARRLLEPETPSTPADPEGAYALLGRARELAKGDNLRARLLLDMADASRRAGNQARVIQDLQTYLAEYPKGADHDSARLQLGEAQLAAGQGDQAARPTFADLARGLQGKADPKSRDLRARALRGVARTYGIPAPPDDTALNLGVAALMRLLADNPGHPLAVRSAYEIGAAYLARGKSQEALGALTAFLKGGDFKAESDEARKDLAELTMTAQFQVGQILQGQEKFAEAIDAFQGYLARFPNGPQSADAQRAILDTELAAAQDQIRLKQYAKARAAWQAFVTRNPLDARVPQILFQVGESFAAERKFDDAIAAWETLAGKFPGTEPAAHALFQAAALTEVEKADPAAAIDRFKKVAVEPWQSQARQRIAVMESKALTVITPRAFRSGEPAQLKIATRNIETLTFTAFKLDAEAYFRKKLVMRGVESLDIGLVRPDAEWTAPVPGFAKFRPIDAAYDLKVSVPGVWVVKVSDEKTLQATTLVLGTDVEAIVKASRDQVLVFAQDIKTGKGRPDARILIADGSGVILEGKTGPDGVLLTGWQKPRDPGSPLNYLVLDGADAAGSGLGVPQQVAQGLTPRAYLYTDRPAYRPGQDVGLRGVVREVKDGQYGHEPGAEYRLEVFDSRGRLFLAQAVKLSAFGTFALPVALDESAPVGSYRVRLYQPGKSDFAGQFEVQAYQLEKVDLSFELPRTVYYRGETIKADLVARYQYGTPLAGRPIDVQLPDGRTLHAQTDASGKFHVELPTDGFAEERALSIVAQLPQDNVGATANVMLAVRAFRIDLATPREVYLDGESFTLKATTLDAQGEPTGQELAVSVLKRVEQAGRLTEREASKGSVATDPKTGVGTLALKVDDARGGNYIVRVSGTDRFGNPVVADRPLTISGRDDEVRLRILAEQSTFKVGQTAEVNLFSRSKLGTALLAWEADRILRYKLVELKEGDNKLAWDVDGAQFPNFTLTASRMDETKLHQAQLDVRVERDLRVTLKPTKPSVGPGEAVEIDVTTTDQLGHPVAAELSLAAVDAALLRLHEDRLPPIGSFFDDRKRTGSFSTESTIAFRYEPATVAVAEAVVEEQGRLLAQGKELAGVDRISLGAQGIPTGGMEPNAAMPAPMEAAAAPAAENAPALSFRDGEWKSEKKLATESDADMKESDKPADGRKGGGMRHGQSWGYFALNGVTAGGRLGDGAAPREQFVETAYWNPSVVTGKDGKARVTFPAPTALSHYRLTARGVTAAETLLGQTNAEIDVRKDFLVDLPAPVAFTQGDKPRLTARVHHRGLAGNLQVRLTAYAGGREVVQPKALDVKADGVEEILFDSLEIPDGDSVRLTVSAKLGAANDQIIVEVPIRPWGVQAFASASGTASDDATALVGLPAGREYQDPEMLIVVAPTVRRMLIELALGRDAYPLDARARACFPIPPATIADSASDLLAACSALTYLQWIKAADAPEAPRLADRVRGRVAELVTAQNEDGGWPWVAGASNTPARPSDRITSAHALVGLATAGSLGLLPDPGAAERAANYLTQELAKLDPADNATRAAILHALSTRGKATFEQANALNRTRQDLPDAALAHLALTFANLDRASLAGEVLDVLGPRGKAEPAKPGVSPGKSWSGRGPWDGSTAETTALVALAYARVRPQAPELKAAVDWLLANRQGNGWQPAVARGTALAALAKYYGQAQAAEDRYRLVVTVNDQEVYRADVAGPTEGQAVRVPRKALKIGDVNRVRFDVEGRGTFGYAVTLTGFARDFAPEQKPASAANRFAIGRRLYTPADPELDGKALPVGFSVAVNATGFENQVTQVPLGGRARVVIDAWRNQTAGQPAWQRDFLILREHLPAGTTLVEGSVVSQASHFELADGVLTFYFAPDQWPGGIRYDIFGRTPGHYRALPPRLSDANEPGRVHLGPASELTVLAPGEPSTDPYKATPDELYARGKAHFDAGRLAEATGPLEALFGGYTLRDDVAKDSARMLLACHIARYDASKVVQYFEVLKQKAPELVIPFDQIRVVGRAYTDIGEHERAYLVWRAIAEASYLEDGQVGETLRQRGKTLAGVAYLLRLWREYPDTASIRADFFALAQVLAGKASQAQTDPTARRELADARVTRPELLLQAIRLTQSFLCLAPADPLADEAGLALVGAFLDLGKFDAVVKLSRRLAELYPRSNYLDSFQYSEALGRFHLGEYDRAIAVAKAIARATYKDANGVDQPSPNKWQALYILGQIHDARRQPGKALAYYEQVADRFGDAAGAVRALKRQDLSLPEIAVVRPSPALAGAEKGGPASSSASVPLGFRNVAEADVAVYPVDLMRLFLTRRDLSGITGIDLAGITPLTQLKLKLGDGADYAAKSRELTLPLDREGAYLVMARGGPRYASGIVLVSPLDLDVEEEADNGRVRVTVREAVGGALVPGVQVKVIGTDTGSFLSGETDLRGVFVAEGVRGKVTAVARRGTDQYALYRGTQYVGQPQAPNTPPAVQNAQPEAGKPNAAESLDANVKGLNRSNQDRQLQRLQERYKDNGRGVQVDKAR